MKKIDAHLHLVRDLASYKGNGRSNALGNGLAVWDSGFKTRLFPAGWGEDSFRVDAAEKVLADHDVAKAVPDRFAPAFSVDPFASEAVGLAKEIVGAKRLLWGSDEPWSATFNDYGQLYSWLEDSGIFSETELADIYYGNAKRIYFKADHVAALKASRDPLFEGDA